MGKDSRLPTVQVGRFLVKRVFRENRLRANDVSKSVFIADISAAQLLRHLAQIETGIKAVSWHLLENGRFSRPFSARISQFPNVIYVIQIAFARNLARPLLLEGKMGAREGADYAEQADCNVESKTTFLVRERTPSRR